MPVRVDRYFEPKLKERFKFSLLVGTHGGVMVSALDSESSGPARHNYSHSYHPYRGAGIA